MPKYFGLSGLKTDLGLLNTGKAWGYTILICIMAFVGKFLGCALAAKHSGFGLREASAIGTLMTCKGCALSISYYDFPEMTLHQIT